MRYLALTLALFLYGCGGFGVVQVPAYIVTDTQVNRIAETYTAKDSDWYEAFANCDDAANLQRCLQDRRKHYSQLLLIIDHRYAAYEGNILAGNAKAEFYPNAVRSTLEVGATLFTPTTTKSILAATAALTGNLQDSAQKAFYYEATAPALIIQMRADRKDVLADILEKLNGAQNDYWRYPVESLLRDMNQYYRAGTMASAVSSLAEAAAGKEEEADRRLTQATN